MAYTVPRVEIEQQFVQTPIFANNPLAAFIFGPNYRPIRYTEAAEKAYCLLGSYSASAGIALKAYPWITEEDSSATVDASKNADGTFAHITPYVENAFACYFTSSSSVVIGTYTSTHNYAKAIQTSPDSDTYNNLYYTNLIQAENIYFANGVNPNTGELYSRSSYFGSRDVQVGDWVAVTGNNYNGDSKTIMAEIVEVLADESTGEVNILRTAQRIFDLIPARGGTNANWINPLSSAQITIALYFRKSAEMPNSFLLETTSSTQVGVASAATLTEAGLIENGSLVEYAIGLPAVITDSSLVPATVYVSYRVLRTDNAVQILALNDPSLVEATLGPVVPENPLAEGVYDALLNASGTNVYYMGVPTDDLAGYNVVLEQAKRTTAIYGMVPLTFNTTIIDAVKAHVEAMSTAAQAKWRKAWICLNPTTQGILAGYDRAAANVYWRLAAAPAADPETMIDRVFVTLESSSGSYNPSLVANGVRSGDILRVFNTDDGSTISTTATYTDYEIDEVRSQDQLTLTEAVTASSHYVVQILRAYSRDEQITMLGAASGSARRVNAVFPATCKTAGVDKDGYFVAAALAALRAGSVPHQPLTNVELLGFDDFTETLVNFTPTQLDNLAAYGYWIIQQDTVGGTPYVRHQLTTEGYNDVGEDPKFSEDSLTTNVDSISYGLQRAIAPYIGRYNVNTTTEELVRAAIAGQLKYNMLNSTTISAGPQLLGYTWVSYGRSTIFKDRIEAKIELDLPYPLNKVTITLVVP